MKLGVMVRICKVFLVHNSQKAVSPAKMIFLALDCFVLFQLVISLSFDKFAALCKSRGEKGSIHETWLRPKIYMGRLNFLAWWVNFWAWVKSSLPPEICVTRKKKGFFLSFHESLKILRFECSHPKLVAPECCCAWIFRKWNGIRTPLLCYTHMNDIWVLSFLRPYQLLKLGNFTSINNSCCIMRCLPKNQKSTLPALLSRVW